MYVCVYLLYAQYVRVCRLNTTRVDYIDIETWSNNGNGAGKRVGV